MPYSFLHIDILVNDDGICCQYPTNVTDENMGNCYNDNDEDNDNGNIAT